MQRSFGLVPLSGSAGSGSDRGLLSQGSDRALGYWDPAVTGIFDNTGLSPVVLDIDDTGLWIVGFRGYVKADAGTANIEVDLMVGAQTVPDTLNDGEFAGAGTLLIDDGGDHWFQAMAAVEVTEPSKLAAWLYPNVGDVLANQTPTAGPFLFAWPIG